MNRKIATGIAIVVAVVLAVWLLFFDGKTSSLFETKQTPQSSSMLTLSSPVFEEGESIPSKYTCDGANVNPPFSISGTPQNTQSLAIIMVDPDIPESVKQSRGIQMFDHWVAWNIPPQTTIIEEGKDAPGTLGNNGAGKKGYTGPCPPDKEHRYFFTLYALDAVLKLSEGSTKADLEKTMTGHIIESTELMGRYNRTK